MDKLYQTNKDFKEYVDRYSKKYVECRSITVEEALEHKTVTNYADYLKELKA